MSKILVCLDFLSRIKAGMIMRETAALTWRGESLAGRSRTGPRRSRRRDCRLKCQAIQTSKARALRQWRGEPAQKRHTMDSRTAANTSKAGAQSRVNKNCHQENSLALAASTMTAYFCRDTLLAKRKMALAPLEKKLVPSSNNAKVVRNKLRSYEPRITFVSKKWIIHSRSDQTF